MFRILVVDDEEKIRKLIHKYATFEGYEVEEAANGMAAIRQYKTAQSQGRGFDLVILDIMMPELDGFTTCKELRRLGRTPILMLSARGEEYDKIHGFELGIDDYVVKPFSPRELMMRVGAIIKRSQAPQDTAQREVVCFPGVKVDFTARTVWVDGKQVDMSPKEYELFFYMVRNRGIALTREKLINEVWGYDFYGDDRTLDTHIKLLRKTLGPYSGYIVTLRSVGYRFEAEQETPAEEY